MPDHKLGDDGLWALRGNIKSIPLLPIAGYTRRVTPCRYLSLSFDESNRDKAVEILTNDLKILSGRKLIVGHLAMPFQLQLADTTGSGELSYVLGCLLFLDDRRLEKLVGKEKWREEGYKPEALNKLFGLKTETLEGAIGNSELRKTYEIEEVNIFEHEAKERQDAYLKSCKEQKEYLDKKLKRQYEEEKKWQSKKEEQHFLGEIESLINEVNTDLKTLISDKEE